MKHGLIPKRQSWDRNLKATFFWDSFELARMICDYEAVILEVKIPEGMKITSMWNEAHRINEYFVCEKIGPVNLSIMKEKKE